MAILFTSPIAVDSLSGLFHPFSSQFHLCFSLFLSLSIEISSHIDARLYQVSTLANRDIMTPVAPLEDYRVFMCRKVCKDLNADSRR